MAAIRSDHADPDLPPGLGPLIMLFQHAEPSTK